jgi:hypothetical protein
MKKRRRYNPRKYDPRRGGHAPGHLRDIFIDMVQLLEEDHPITLDSKLGEPDKGNPYTVREIVGLLWNCGDILPAGAYDALVTAGLEFNCRTYGAAARALRRSLEEAR